MTEWWNDFFDADYIRVYERQDELAGPEADFVRKTLGLRRGQRVLDVCWYGRHALPLAQAGLQGYRFRLLTALFERAGLAVTETLGSHDGIPYGLDTPRMIVVGRKPKK